jgi:hypothetical protein
MATSEAIAINSWVETKTAQLTELLKAHPEFKTSTKEQIISTLKLINESDLDVETSIVADKDGISINELGALIGLADSETFKNAKQTLV